MRKNHIYNKSLIAVLFLALLGTGIHAQNHLQFKGHELKGNISTFRSILVRDGMRHVEDNTSMGQDSYYGKFANLDAFVMVNYTPKSKTVFSAIVAIVNSDLVTIETNFITLYKSLTKKYSDSTTVPIIEILSNNEGDGNGVQQDAHFVLDLLESVENENNLILDREKSTVWITPEGRILLAKVTGRDQSCIFLIYMDQQGQELYEKEREAIISNDI